MALLLTGSGLIFPTGLTSPLGDVISLHDLSYHLYEDDAQLYVTFKTTFSDDMNVAR